MLRSRSRSRSGRGLFRRLRRDLALLITALGLAVVIWFVITDSENETVVQQFGFALPVEAVNIPGDLATASRIPPALIEIGGRQVDIDNTAQNDFIARVDLSGLPAGTHEIPISITSRNDDVSVRSVQPQFVQVTLESVVSRLVQVTVQVENSPPLGFDVGDPVAEAATVTVRGIEQLVELVDAVVARVDIGGATVDVDATVSLQARTSTGASVGAVQISPPSIDVRIPVQQEIFRRAVAVTPEVVGEPASGFRVDSISVDPVTVVVVGTLDALEKAGSATTTPISISGRGADLQAEVAVVPPEGLALEQPGQMVIVSVGLATFIEEAVFQVPVEVTGLGGGLEARVEPERVAVRVRGPAPDIAALDPASFRVTVNAIGASPGFRTEPIQVSFSGDLDIVSVTPGEVALLVEAPPPPEPDPPPDEEPEDGSTSGNGNGPTGGG